jgi:hypothetical protein
MAEGTIGGTKLSDLPASSYAYCEPGDGAPSQRCHFPIRGADGKPDAAHVRNAMARMGQSPFGDRARAKIMAAAKELGIGMEGKAEPLDRDELQGWLEGKRPRRLLAIPFGGPLPNPLYAKGMDLDREWFSERTDIKPHWFEARPVCWHHGDDLFMGNEPLGKAVNPTLEEDGWWVDVWMTARDRRIEAIRKLAEALASKGGDLWGSSAPIGRFVKTSKTGEILVWPYAEQTLSTSPQNTKSVLRPGKAVVDFDLAGISISDPLREILVELDALGTDLAVTSTGLYLPGTGDPSAKAGRVLSGSNETELRSRLIELRKVIDAFEQFVDGMAGTSDMD